MPMWRCPNCGTPQPEADRCWVCRRSSTTCSTCRHFRESLAASVGYCGLDRRRVPLHGTEHRGCWEAAATRLSPSLDDVASAAAPDAPARGGRTGDAAVARLRPATRRRPGVLEGWVPIELSGSGPRTLRPADGAALPSPPVVEVVESWADRETLFGDA